jgi:hypothetical protein
MPRGEQTGASSSTRNNGRDPRRRALPGRGELDRADVLAHLRHDRDEDEIVVLPESVQITSVIELEPEQP